MTRRRRNPSVKGLMKSPIVKYGLYAGVAYFVYNWWKGNMPQYTSIPASTPATPPTGTK